MNESNKKTMKWITYVRGIIPLQRVFPIMYGCKGKIKVVFYNRGKEMVYAWDAIGLKKRSKEVNHDLAITLEKRMKKAITISESFIGCEASKKNYDKLFNFVFDILGDANIYIDAFDEFPTVTDVPLYSSVMARLHQEMYKLYCNFSKQKKDEIYKKYWWTSLGWENMIPYNKEEFFMHHYETEPITIKNTGNDLASIMAELHDLRKELQMKSSYAFYQMIEKIAKEKNVLVEEIDWMLPKELFKDEHVDIKKRKRLFFFEVDTKIQMYYGSEAEKLGNSLLLWKESEEITGKVAYPGKVTGKVRICKGVLEAKNIKKNEILITGMTTPDYVPYMKKALAMVTNEGGLTCHAGIIAREIKKPCVVGTMYATELFKTGDIIEVDATNGVVRKLK